MSHKNENEKAIHCTRNKRRVRGAAAAALLHPLRSVRTEKEKERKRKEEEDEGDV